MESNAMALNHRLKEETPDFDVHDDAANLKAGSVILNLLCFIFVVIGTYATFFWLAIVVLCVAFPALIITKSKVVKKLAVSALLGVLGAAIPFWIPGWVKY